jgi:hypothetical protein
LYWIEPCEIHGESCTYGAKYIRPVNETLNFVTEVKTYHKYGGYYGFIRPSMDEAIYQCPKDILDDVVAVDGSQQVRRQARHAGDSHLGFRVLPFHELHFRIDGTVLQGHLRRFDGANLKGFKIYKFHLGLDASGTQEGRRKEYIALFHRLTMHN